MASFASIVLAGGASSRMGRAKALLPFGHEPLVERIVRRVAPLSSEVIVVSGPHLQLPTMPSTVRIVVDDDPLQGPLSGLRYGLRATTEEVAFVCGCDHPFLAASVVELVVECCTRSADTLAAWSTWDGSPQPLVASYRTAILPIVEEMLAAGKRRIVDLAMRAKIAEVPPSELRAMDPSGRSFVDVDTPEDYERALLEPL
jgi:molybdopterin-guanine dinucleotide biosynthesis protein A